MVDGSSQARRWRYVVDRWEASRWQEAGDFVADGPDEAVRVAAVEAGTYRARPEGDPPESAQLYRVQLSGRPVPIDML